MNPVSLMANAEKLSIGQLQQAVKNGTVPAYIGIPMMQEKMKQAKQAQPTQAPTEPPIAQQVMAEASGIDQMPSNLPTQSMNDGGIVSFADGGDAEDFDQEAYEEQQDEAEYAQAIEDSLNAAEQGGGASKSSVKDVNRTPNVEGGIKAPAGDFYKNMYGVLKAKAEEMGFKNPEAIARVGAAQSALETGHGKALAGGNNYFGIKGGNNKQKTQEFDPSTGKMYTANESFRTYGGMEDSAADYLRLMQNPRYQKVAMAGSPEEAIAHQSRSGYATDPQYGSKLASIHRANMAEGGIARLNNGGIPRYQSAGRVSFWDAVNPREYQRDPGYRAFADNEQGNKTYDAYLAAGNEPYVKPASSTDWLPDDIYQVTPQKRTPKHLFLSEMYYENSDAFKRFLPKGKTLVPIYPEVPLSERSKYLQHGATFGETGLGGADTYYPPSPAGSDAARFREQASGAVDAASPSATPNVPSNKGMSPEYEPSVLGGMGMSPEYEPSTNVPAGNTGNTDSSGSSSSGGSGSGSGNGSSGGKQKSEYDLIREDIMNQRAELKRQKQEDKYMAIIQAGLGMMAGTSPNAFANIGQGASSGIAQYGSSSKQRAAENAALNKGLISAQRYKSMDDYQRAALADRAAGRTELAEIRADEKANTLSQQDKALMIRTEDNTIAGISRREKQIEDNIKGLFKMDAFGQFESGQMEKYNQAVAKAKAEDNDLKKYHTRMGALQKSLYNLDYTPPNYGTTKPANLPSLTDKRYQ